MSAYALIPAAGSGTRIPASGPKQYVRLAGRPMLWHSLRALCVPRIESVFVILAPEDRRFATHDWSEFGDRLQPLYCGGQTRRDSVYNGLVAAMAVVQADDWILVHDAARPCLPAKDLDKLMREIEGDEVGGILALPVVDTIKKVSDSKIQSTQERSQFWLAQTPQMFRAGLLAQALTSAKGSPTDEAAAVEQLGLKPRVVAGSRENLKVTWPEDVAIAEGILRRRA